jgi:eukaryotic-like serine/threonine-protein kinase
VVLYEVTTGRLPFDGESYFQTIGAISRRAHSPVKRLRRDAPEALIAVIDRLLKKSPAERYQSAAAVAQDLKAITQTEKSESLE